MGKTQISLESSWNTLEGFVESLRAALTQEMKTIRETTFDPSTEVEAELFYESHVPQIVTCRLDTLGRLLVPYYEGWPGKGVVTHVKVNDSMRKVVAHDLRYVGDVKKWVIMWLEDTKL